MRKHDMVCSKCSHPATGFVLRAGKHWVDVEWHAGIKSVYRSRVWKKHIMEIADILSNAVRSNINKVAE